MDQFVILVVILSLHLFVILFFILLYFAIDLAVYIKIFIIKKKSAIQHIYSLYKNIPSCNKNIFRVILDIFYICLVAVLASASAFILTNTIFPIPNDIDFGMLAILIPILIISTFTFLVPIDKVVFISRPIIRLFGFSFSPNPVGPQGYILTWEKGTIWDSIYRITGKSIRYGVVLLPITAIPFTILIFKYT